MTYITEELKENFKNYLAEQSYIYDYQAIIDKLKAYQKDSPTCSNT